MLYSCTGDDDLSTILHRRPVWNTTTVIHPQSNTIINGCHNAKCIYLQGGELFCCTVYSSGIYLVIFKADLKKKTRQELTVVWSSPANFLFIIIIPDIIIWNVAFISLFLDVTCQTWRHPTAYICLLVLFQTCSSCLPPNWPQTEPKQRAGNSARSPSLTPGPSLSSSHPPSLLSWSWKNAQIRVGGWVEERGEKKGGWREKKRWSRI